MIDRGGGGLSSDCESDTDVCKTAGQKKEVLERLKYMKAPLTVNVKSLVTKKNKSKNKKNKASGEIDGNSVNSDSAMDTEVTIDSGKNLKRNNIVKSNGSAGSDSTVVKKVAQSNDVVVIDNLVSDVVNNDTVEINNCLPISDTNVSGVSVTSVPKSSDVLPKPKDKKKRKIVGNIGDEFSLTVVQAKFAEVRQDMMQVYAKYPEAIIDISRVLNGMEDLVLGLSGANERLRGQLDVLDVFSNNKAVNNVLSGEKNERVLHGVPIGIDVAERPSFQQMDEIVKVSAGVTERVKVTPAPPAVKPVETWSLVVTGKNNETSKELKKKLVEEVLPSTGVRIHAVLTSKSGDVVIKTTSIEERNAVLKNKKIEEIGLSATTNNGGDKFIVLGVDRLISPEDFMHDLYNLNFNCINCIKEETFKKEIKLVNPWKIENGKVSVVLYCGLNVADAMSDSNWVYVKHFSYRVIKEPIVRHCFKCLGLNHPTSRCRQVGMVCKRCGQVGHSYRDCVNPINCWDCNFKGNPAGHYMLSMDCPIYAAEFAGVKANH